MSGNMYARLLGTPEYSTPKSMMEVPKDRHNFVFVSVYFFGLAFIMPWQILVVMSGYWHERILASHLTVASTIPYAISITLHALIGQKFSIRLRVYCSQVNLTRNFTVLFSVFEFWHIPSIWRIFWNSYFSDRHGFYIGFHHHPLQIGHWWMARHVPQPNHRRHRIRQHFQCHFPRLRFILTKPISTRISWSLGQRGRYGRSCPLHPQRHLPLSQSGRQIVRIRLLCLCFSHHNHDFRPYIRHGKVGILPILFG